MADLHDNTHGVVVPFLAADPEPQHIRDLFELATEARRDGWTVDQARAAAALYTAEYGARPAPLLPAPVRLDGVRELLAHRNLIFQQTGSSIMGWRSGLATLDERLGGLQGGRLTILIAQPGAGKTTLASQLAYTVADQGAPVLYVTFENSADSLILRTVARIGSFSVRAVDRGEIPPNRLAGAFEVFERNAQRLFIVDGTRQTTVDALEAYVAQIREQHPAAGVPLVVVDYLQRLAATNTTERDARIRVEQTSQRLAELGKSAGAHVLAISSTNRAAYSTKDSRPTLASARESGSIEFDADHVLSLARPEKESLDSPSGCDPLCLEIAKNRHGAMGTVDLIRDWSTLAITEPPTRGVPQVPAGGGLGPATARARR